MTMNYNTLLVTGGCGFIGSNFIHYWRERHPDAHIVNYDLLTYAGNLANVADLDGKPGYTFIQGDIGDLEAISSTLSEHQPEVIVNFAAESHNSRALIDPSSFVRTNVLGTHVLLEAARQVELPRFHHVSTCEVFGDLALDSDDKFREDYPYRPRTPYNASKAGADHLVRAYHETFGLQTTLSYCANNYGPYQHPEKLIPHFISQLIKGEKLPLYQSSDHKREWINVLDHCSAIECILLNGKPGESYNIGSELEMDIEEVADRLLAAFDLDQSYKTYVPDRPGHDRRYLLDSAKIRKELGWEAQHELEASLATTVQWYRDNEDWWQPLAAAAAIDEAAWQK